MKTVKICLIVYMSVVAAYISAEDWATPTLPPLEKSENVLKINKGARSTLGVTKVRSHKFKSRVMNPRVRQPKKMNIKKKGESKYFGVRERNENGGSHSPRINKLED